MEKIHRRSFAEIWEEDTRGGDRDTCVVSSPQVMTSVVCQVEGFLTRSHTPGRLRKIHVKALEGPCVNPEGGSSPLAAVPKLWHAHASSVDVTAPTNGQMQTCNKHETEVVRCGTGHEGWTYGF